MKLNKEEQYKHSMDLCDKRNAKERGMTVEDYKVFNDERRKRLYKELVKKNKKSE